MPKKNEINEKSKIGQFIRHLREQKNLTQEELAESLETTQSAIARMEAGEQNFTIETLERVSKALNHQILALDASVDFKIQGGHKLSGEITTNCSKNGAMGLLCATLLNKGKTILHGIPRIEEVFRIIEVMESIGVEINWTDNNSIQVIPPSKLDLDAINADSARKTRTIIMFWGPLIHLFKDFELPNSQGCKLGRRTIAAHQFGLEKMGAKVKVTNNSYQIKVGELKPSEIVMYESGDTATENLLMAASKIPGKTVIKYASSNYMVQDVCFFLQKCGVRIEGIGTSTLTVYGVGEINETIEHYNSEDPIEAMTFLSAAITTKSQITIKRAPIDFLELELLRLERMGFKYKMSKKYKSKNGQTSLVDLTTLPSQLKAIPEKITCGPYPDINIDNLPFFVPIATQAVGTTLIHDWVYEDRIVSFMELSRLNAKLILADPHRLYVEGPVVLKPGQIVCPPILRSAMVVLIAMLAADGTSVLRNVYSIRRGYEEIAERLNTLGAKIKVIREI